MADLQYSLGSHETMHHRQVPVFIHPGCMQESCAIAAHAACPCACNTILRAEGTSWLWSCDSIVEGKELAVVEHVCMLGKRCLTF